MIRSDLGARKHLSKSPNDHSAFPVRNKYKTAGTIFHGARLQDTEEPNRRNASVYSSHMDEYTILFFST